MKICKIACIALAVCLFLASCSKSPSPSWAVAASPSPSPIPSPTPTAAPAPHGQGVTMYYSDSWNGMLSSLVLLGRLLDGGWEDWIIGSATEDGRPITLHDAADISNDLPVLCETPQVELGDAIYLYSPDGYAEACSAVGIYFRNWAGTGISSIYLSTEDMAFPAETPLLGFSDINPAREIIPMTFDGDKGFLEADFDGDGAPETIEFEYIPDANVVKRFFVKGESRVEMERLGCKDFSTMYACAVNIDGGSRYWLFERNTEIRFGYFALSGWKDSGMGFIIKMDM